MDAISDSRMRVLVVSLIYKSPAWADFVYTSFRRHTPEADFLFVANDATQKVLAHLESMGYPHVVNENPPISPSERQKLYMKLAYMRNVYRGWNRALDECGKRNAIAVLVNSDMAFSAGWLGNLLKRIDKKTVPTSRLVQPIKGIEWMNIEVRDFGRTVSSFDERGFLSFADAIRDDSTMPFGPFMPVALTPDVYNSVKYPEGNMRGPRGNVLYGDREFFTRLAELGIERITSMDSVVYHVNEGEMRS